MALIHSRRGTLTALAGDYTVSAPHCHNPVSPWTELQFGRSGPPRRLSVATGTYFVFTCLRRFRHEQLSLRLQRFLR